MSFPFYIARRYLFSKKSTHAINVISLISVIGVAVATMALVVVLSGFNGFSDLVASFFTNFDPQLKVEAAKGKTIAADNPLLHKIKTLPSIEVATECVADQALATYQGKQIMVTVKGVAENFDSLTNTAIYYRRWNFQTAYCQLRLWYLRYWRSTTAKHGHRLEKLSTHICTTTKRTIRCIEPYECLRGRLATIAKKHIPSKAKQIRQQLYYYIATVRTTTFQQTGRNYIARTTSKSGRRYR